MCKDGTRGERVKRLFCFPPFRPFPHFLFVHERWEKDITDTFGTMTAAVKSGQRRPDEDMLREEKVHAQYITLSPVDSRFISICVTNFSSDRDYSHDWHGDDDDTSMVLPCS